jgi:membrane protein implicated in regulation of membrane protease activity
MIGWIAALLCIIGNLLVIRKFNGFLIWFVGTGVLLILAILKKDWYQVFLFLIYEIINIFGYITWSRDNKNKRRKFNWIIK